VGLVNAFLGVSTFRARLLLNIHDICVHPHFQRRGIGAAWQEVVAHAARSEGCCRITLEVLEGNLGALAAYRRAGLGVIDATRRSGRQSIAKNSLERRRVGLP